MCVRTRHVCAPCMKVTWSIDRVSDPKELELQETEVWGRYLELNLGFPETADRALNHCNTLLVSPNIYFNVATYIICASRKRHTEM